MWRLTRKALAVVFALGAAALVSAQDISGADMRSLDGQVQDVKSDALNIAAELNNLEERLLFPSNTQVSVFVTIAENEEFRLDAVQVTIDGEPATHHIYSFNELEALRKGGVQRIFTGNIPTGNHEIAVNVNGKLKNGNDFSESGSFTFTKGVKPKMLGITLAQPGFGTDAIQVGNW